MIDLRKKITNSIGRHPRIFYVLYALAVVIILDFTMGVIFRERLATHPDYYVKGLRSKDSLCHHRLEKNVDTLDHWGNDTYHIVTNSLGFKDSFKRFIRPEPGVRRFVFIGDSFTEGVGLPYEKTFVGIISNALGERNVEVLNAGVCSYSPKLYYLKMLHLIRDEKLKIDKLFVFTDMSDIQDEIIYKDYVPDHYERGTSFGDYLKLYAIKYSVIGNITDRLLRSTWKAYTAPRDEADIILNRFMDGYRDEKEFEDERSAWYTDQNYRDWGYQGSVFAGYYMSELADLCKKNNIELVLAVYPWPRQVYENQDENKHVLFWKAFAREQRIRFINFFPFFMHADPTRTVFYYYFPGNVHFNEAGNSLIAREFLKWYTADPKQR